LLQVCDEVYFDPGAGQTSVWITRLTVSDPISTPPEEEPVAPDGRRWPHLLALIAVLGLTLGARILWLPKPLEPRQVDEPAYMFDSLLLFEGITPGHHAVPAGLQLWIEWIYVGCDYAADLLHPSPMERQVPPIARPAYTLERTLFDIYRDPSHLRMMMLWINAGFALLATSAAWSFGRRAGGWLGAVLSGGFVAILPLYCDLGASARSIMMAIALVICCLAIVQRSDGLSKYLIGAAICFGLAMGSRIETLLYAPLVAALVIADAGWKRGIWNLVKFAFIACIAFIVIAPWYPITLLGNIRSIVGVRVIAGDKARFPLHKLLFEYAWTNALIVPTLLALWSWRGARSRQRAWLVPAAVTLVLLTLLGAAGTELRYQTPVLTTAILFASMGIPLVPKRFIAIIAGLVFASLALAGIDSYRQAKAWRDSYVPDTACDWIEQHVPAGTRIYWPYMLGKFILPTTEAGDRLWAQATDAQSWRIKQGWASGAGGSTLPPPRATSAEILLKEVAPARHWFILAGRPDVTAPRYDIISWAHSTIFGELDPVGAFRKNGGVLVYRGAKPANLPEPAVSWTKNGADGTFIFVSPDIHLK
jgi:hypothetical protein